VDRNKKNRDGWQTAQRERRKSVREKYLSEKEWLRQRCDDEDKIEVRGLRWEDEDEGMTYYNT
jgi:hypothetical protein